MATMQVILTDDTFIHFTYIERAKQIMLTRKLLINPPYEHFGIEGVQAVSINYGEFVPLVQLNHLRANNGLKGVVAILFQTDTKPRYGTVEEVIWKTDVNLINPKIISIQDARAQLDAMPGVGDDQILMYESILVRLRGDYKL